MVHRYKKYRSSCYVTCAPHTCYARYTCYVLTHVNKWYDHFTPRHMMHRRKVQQDSLCQIASVQHDGLYQSAQQLT